VKLEPIHLPVLPRVQSVLKATHALRVLWNQPPVQLTTNLMADFIALKELVWLSHAHPENTVAKAPSHQPHAQKDFTAKIGLSVIATSFVTIMDHLRLPFALPATGAPIPEQLLLLFVPPVLMLLKEVQLVQLVHLEDIQQLVQLSVTSVMYRQI